MGRVLPLLLLAAGACSASEPPLMIDASNEPATVVGHEPQMPVEKVRSAVRMEAQRLYREECGMVLLPDRAFVPIEVTGGGHPEYAVLLGRGSCEMLRSANLWKGTGGDTVQIWLASAGPPRMLLEHSMHGFTPTDEGLLSLQHGGYCPGGAGPGMCLVTYRWNGQDRRLEVAGRRLYDYRNPGEPPRMTFDYETISR